MEKVHMIGWALLLMLAVSSAVTIYVTSEQDAIAELNKSVDLVQGKCYVSSIEKSVTSEEEIASKQYEAKIVLEFTKDGVFDRRFDTINTDNTDEKALKPAVAKLCDEMWSKIQEEKGMRKTVVIRPEASILNQWYDLATKTWQNMPAGRH